MDIYNISYENVIIIQYGDADYPESETDSDEEE